MFDINYTDLDYEQYTGLNESNQPSYAAKTTIRGMRVKGEIKVIHNENDGDSTTCTICYRTNNRIVKNSRLNGREVVDCVPVSTFGLDEAYLSYVK